MALEVTFSKRADHDFENLLNYIQLEFGDTTAIRFKYLIIEFAHLLQSFPEIGILELADKNIRCSVIHRRLKIYYRIKDKKIVILRLYDTRQNPAIRL
jgi:plasmid stabilization system protein ParE